ncbi:hypothetical protein N9B23_02295, partial [bacterium]|nr:hypothetical protein [bacterium]
VGAGQIVGIWLIWLFTSRIRPRHLQFLSMACGCSPVAQTTGNFCFKRRSVVATLFPAKRGSDITR